MTFTARSKNSYGTKSHKYSAANVHHLIRILTFLGEVEFAHKTTISKDALVPQLYINSAIQFLVSRNLIYASKTTKGSRWGNVVYYSLVEQNDTRQIPV